MADIQVSTRGRVKTLYLQERTGSTKIFAPAASLTDSYRGRSHGRSPIDDPILSSSSPKRDCTASEWISVIPGLGKLSPQRETGTAGWSPPSKGENEFGQSIEIKPPRLIDTPRAGYSQPR